MAVIAGIKPRMSAAAGVAVRKGFHFGGCLHGRRVFVSFIVDCGFIAAAVLLGPFELRNARSKLWSPAAC